MNKTVELLQGAMDSIDGSKAGMDAVIGDIEEAIVAVERLLVSAKNLRAAQRDYMADRGNEELGRRVGQRAQELDGVIAEWET